MEKWLDFSLSASDMCLKKKEGRKKDPSDRNRDIGRRKAGDRIHEIIKKGLKEEGRQAV